MASDVLPQSRAGESLVTRWLRHAPPALFALYGGLAAFGVYFSMYAFRKPFTVAGFEHVAGWPFAFDFKIALVIAQVAGYALSKVLGVKVISEMRPERRALAILVVVGAAELALALFAMAPPALGLAALFLNGLCLGLVWGLVFGFLEGRRLSEVLGAMLCASFILSSGVVKSVGKTLLLDGIASEHWMPALSGLIFLPLLLFSVAALAQLPPPCPLDEAARVRRAPMNAGDRRRVLATYGPGLAALIAAYVLLTAFRDFRDNFAAEIWTELGFGSAASVFTLSEIPVAVIVLVGLAALMRVRDNRRAVFWNLAFVAAGALLMGGATLAHQLHVLGPIGWMVATGAGLYMAYTPFNGILFDRLIAATGSIGTAGFLIYLADAGGYVGSVVLLLYRNLFDARLDWVSFLSQAAYAACGFGLVMVALASWYFAFGRARLVSAPQAA